MWFIFLSFFFSFFSSNTLTSVSLYIDCRITATSIIRIAKTHAFYSVLFYPITLECRRGTTYEFVAIPFHFVLFAPALVELAMSIPVHSLILSSHLFFCLPLLLFLLSVVSIVFAKPEDLETCPNHRSFRFLTRVRSSSVSNDCLDLSAGLQW